jgi:hypothetical protein
VCQSVLECCSRFWEEVAFTLGCLNSGTMLGQHELKTQEDSEELFLLGPKEIKTRTRLNLRQFDGKWDQ